MEFISGSEETYKAFGTWKFKQRPNLERPIKLGGTLTTVIDLTRQAVKSMAEMHAYFWKNKEFIDANKSWVARYDWFQGKNLDTTYPERVKMIKDLWTGWCQGGWVKGTVTYKFHPKVKEIIDASYAKSTPEGFKQYYLREDFPWTCTHGDTHPANWVFDPKKSSLIMIDMELFGIGHPMNDVASWMMIRTDKNWIRKYEKEVIELYYETLIEFGAKFGTSVTRETYTLE